VDPYDLLGDVMEVGEWPAGVSTATLPPREGRGSHPHVQPADLHDRDAHVTIAADAHDAARGERVR
jgi:hypothetical protein